MGILPFVALLAEWGVHYTVSFLAAFGLHEFGHFLAARRLRFARGEAICGKNEMLLAAAGPLANILFCVILLILDLPGVMLLANMTFAFINLIPALPTDGGKILRSILNLQFSYRKLSRFLTVLGLFWGVFGLFFACFVGSFTLFLLCLQLIFLAFSEYLAIDMVWWRNLLLARESTGKQYYYLNENLTVAETVERLPLGWGFAVECEGRDLLAEDLLNIYLTYPKDASIGEVLTEERILLKNVEVI